MLARMWTIPPTHRCEGCKTVRPLWKMVWQFLIKLNILLPYNPAIIRLGIYPKELKTYIHTKTCTRMFIAALFIIVKTEATKMSFST